MRMILRAFPNEFYVCQCLLYCEGTYTGVVYHSYGRVITGIAGYYSNYYAVLKHTNEWLLEQL